MRYPESLLKLARALSRLPGVGPKTAQRLALHLAFRREAAADLEAALRGLEGLGVCRLCGNLAEGELCPICQDAGRDRRVMAVVETVADLFALERSGEFRGLYHVLGGALNPLEGVGPKELNLESLWPRLAGVEEVVLATSMTVEGEATALYLAEELRRRGIRATRPAYGLPVGGSLEYADEVTLGRALEGRKPL
ncbi:recombination mediator RecR [Thermus thermamylovorans]|uniref:Recombination protein RecR n=1 Tax=Thermus thermamylovorans TaxID=2509362 RepID=A0A4V6MRE3_9DEIN|nr:recombination mediator RecR [Thermus thermamylovorans]TBH17476.1 recombination protein RecR [Thermus thermamylovorans]